MPRNNTREERVSENREHVLCGALLMRIQVRATIVFQSRSSFVSAAPRGCLKYLDDQPRHVVSLHPPWPQSSNFVRCPTHPPLKWRAILGFRLLLHVRLFFYQGASALLISSCSCSSASVHFWTALLSSTFSQSAREDPLEVHLLKVEYERK